VRLHDSQLYNASDHDGIWLRCTDQDCDLRVHLGFSPTLGQAQALWGQHVLGFQVPVCIEDRCPRFDLACEEFHEQPDQ
jgi:hypothetical protein